MEIKLVVANKEDTEAKMTDSLTSLLEDFHTKTGVNVNNIAINFVYVRSIGEKYDKLVIRGVNLEVTL